MVVGLQASHLCGETRRRRASQSEPSHCPLRELCTTARSAFPHIWQAAAASALAACYSGGNLALGMLPNASKASAGKFKSFFGIPSHGPATGAAENPDSAWNLRGAGLPHDPGISQCAGISSHQSSTPQNVWGCRSGAVVLSGAGILRGKEENVAGIGMNRLGLGEIRNELLASTLALKLEEVRSEKLSLCVQCWNVELSYI